MQVDTPIGIMNSSSSSSSSPETTTTLESMVKELTAAKATIAHLTKQVAKLEKEVEELRGKAAPLPTASAPLTHMKRPGPPKRTMMVKAAQSEAVILLECEDSKSKGVAEPIIAQTTTTLEDKIIYPTSSELNGTLLADPMVPLEPTSNSVRKRSIFQMGGIPSFGAATSPGGLFAGFDPSKIKQGLQSAAAGRPRSVTSTAPPPIALEGTSTLKSASSTSTSFPVLSQPEIEEWIKAKLPDEDIGTGSKFEACLGDGTLIT
jgi:hypothetical protein